LRGIEEIGRPQSFVAGSPKNGVQFMVKESRKYASTGGWGFAHFDGRKTGWQFICLEEEWTRGYLQEIQDFMECVSSGRQPRADLGLAYATTQINYAAYWSAEEGRRIAL
jgi:predicted dehydrogenase